MESVRELSVSVHTIVLVDTSLKTPDRELRLFLSAQLNIRADADDDVPRTSLPGFAPFARPHYNIMNISGSMKDLSAA